MNMHKSNELLSNSVFSFVFRMDIERKPAIIPSFPLHPHHTPKQDQWMWIKDPSQQKSDDTFFASTCFLSSSLYKSQLTEYMRTNQFRLKKPACTGTRLKKWICISICYWKLIYNGWVLEGNSWPLCMLLIFSHNECHQLVLQICISHSGPFVNLCYFHGNGGFSWRWLINCKWFAQMQVIAIIYQPRKMGGPGE